MHHMITRLVCIVLLCLIGCSYAGTVSPVSGHEFTAKVIEVIDGDTVLIKQPNGLLKVRLAEIDAPEKAQTFGEASKRSLSDMVMGKQVKFVSQTIDQYGRMVAHLSVNGLDVNSEQIRRGMAWEYSNFHSNKALIALQEEARQSPRGLWAQSNPTPPWEWRKQHPSSFSAQPNTTGSTTHNPGCGSKKRCAEMTSCDEARFYLTQCGIKSLDGNGDGVPCESLCVPQKTIKN